jgi:hypothetical protein
VRVATRDTSPPRGLATPPLRGPATPPLILVDGGMGRCGAAPSVGAAGTGVVVEVWVVATAVVRELVAVEVDEVAVSLPSAGAGGGCQEAALQQVIHVTSKRGLGRIDDGEAEQRGVEPRQVKRQ